MDPSNNVRKIIVGFLAVVGGAGIIGGIGLAGFMHWGVRSSGPRAIGSTVAVVLRPGRQAHNSTPGLEASMRKGRVSSESWHHAQ